LQIKDIRTKVANLEKNNSQLKLSCEKSDLKHKQIIENLENEKKSLELKTARLEEETK
jgi:hypothetical protein